ncbi:hypothetical protein NECID01_1647 [Nematocida sp. AWRm77]|nr:hypothetical protein NECID01_1647 [Nematocida sp. AWRm77]
MSETDTLAQIKKVSEEIVSQCKGLSKWIVSSAQEVQRENQIRKQEVVRKQELLQSTIEQLKEENTKLLEERQRLALETESGEEEVRKLKERQAQIEQRISLSKAKSQGLSTSLSTQSSELTRLRKTLQQEQDKTEQEVEQAHKKIKWYKETLGMEILPVGNGCVEFIFMCGQKKHFFSIELSDTYIIHKCSLAESKYTDALSNLQSTQDLFVFIRQMKELFVQAEKEN